MKKFDTCKSAAHVVFFTQSVTVFLVRNKRKSLANESASKRVKLKKISELEKQQEES